jgi:predicted kinase
MLIGVPGSGKSTWIRSQNFDPAETVIISSDDIVDRYAAERGKTYSEVFNDVIKPATQEMMANLHDAISQDKDLVWDQTNVGVKARKGKLSHIPDRYWKVAVVFETPEQEEWDRRIGSRTGKNIPHHVLQSMNANMEMPSRDEGFDDVIYVRNNG